MAVTQSLQNSTFLSTLRSAARRRPVLYKGPRPPAKYEADWDKYENLSVADREWFRSQPEDLVKYATQQVLKSDVAELTHSSGVVVRPVINGGGIKFVLPSKDVRTISTADLSAAHAEYLARYYGLQDKLATVTAGINASPPTVTKRQHVDSVFTPAK